MTIPNSQIFEDFFQSLTLSKPNDLNGYERISLSDNLVALGICVPDSEYSIWYKAKGIKYQSVVDKVQKELESRGHVYSKEIVMAILVLYAFIPNKGTSSVDLINFVLDSITGCDVTQIYIFPIEGQGDNSEILNNFSLRVGAFYFGVLDSQRLEYRVSVKTGSDYYEKYKTRLEGRLAFERDFFSIKIIDWESLQLEKINLSEFGTSFINEMKELTDFYFHTLARLLFIDFCNSIREEQNLTVCLGNEVIDPRIFEHFIYSNFVTLFLNIGPRKLGWVAPVGINSLTFDFPGSNSKIPKIIEMLKTEFNFEGYQSSEFHNTIKTFADFFAKSKWQSIDLQKDEAFLHMVIALELLLVGENETPSKTIEERVSVLVHKTFDFSFQDMKKVIKRIYDARSKYVHNGTSPDLALFDCLEKICSTTLLCLLRVQKNTKSHEEGFYQQWLNDITFIASALKANKKTSYEDLHSVGIQL